MILNLSLFFLSFFVDRVVPKSNGPSDGMLLFFFVQWKNNYKITEMEIPFNMFLSLKLFKKQKMFLEHMI